MKTLCTLEVGVGGVVAGMLVVDIGVTNSSPWCHMSPLARSGLRVMGWYGVWQPVDYISFWVISMKMLIRGPGTFE